MHFTFSRKLSKSLFTRVAEASNRLLQEIEDLSPTLGGRNEMDHLGEDWQVGTL
jgi:hypothetical protein